ncbi:MAG: hypothetical protein GYB66_11280 [Chloroflexi bacterium]|nr:hypothetical protein [Chloroflexota bacterium]
MELIAIWKTLRRRWWLIAIPTAITLLWALPALPDAVAPPETYGSTLRFSAAAPPQESNAEAAANDPLARSGTYEDTAYVPWLASEYLVVNLPQWITGSEFANEVSQTLAERGVDISSEDLEAAFSADSSRSILFVYLGWDDEDELEQIAAATIEVLQASNQRYFPQLALQAAAIQPLDEIDIVRTMPPFTSRLQPFIRIFIGLAAGLALAFLADYLDDSIREADELEALEIPVLGTIPRE